MMDTKLKQMLGRSVELHGYLLQHATISGLDERQLLLASFRSLALEHLGSILTLCQAGACGSASALLRPLLETIVRGEWLCFCAHTSYCEAFVQGTYDRGKLSFRSMAREVDSALQTGPRLALLEEQFNNARDFTHTGHSTIVPRLGATATLTQWHDVDQLLLLIRNATIATALHVSLALRVMQQPIIAEYIERCLEDV